MSSAASSPDTRIPPRAPLRKGWLIVVSAPSGAGKTTIAREILRRNPSLRFSVSATTRPMRAGEQDGVDYFYLTQDEFRRRVAGGAFVEWEEIYGDLYGTLKSEVDKALAEGTSILFDVDVKGALSIKRLYPDAVLIFIRPPSVDVLTARLRNRKTEDDATVRRRLERAAMEMAAADKFDYQCVNDDLQTAVARVQTIVERHLGVPENRREVHGDQTDRS